MWSIINKDSVKFPCDPYIYFTMTPDDPENDWDWGPKAERYVFRERSLLKAWLALIRKMNPGSKFGVVKVKSLPKSHPAKSKKKWAIKLGNSLFFRFTDSAWSTDWNWGPRKRRHVFKEKTTAKAMSAYLRGIEGGKYAVVKVSQ